MEKLREGLPLTGLLTRGVKLLKRPNPTEIRWINFAVTYLCDSRCTTCNIWRKYRGNPGLSAQELTLKEIEAAFLPSRCLKDLLGIGLTGGEPFLREDFVELAGFFIKCYPQAFLSIATNGLNTQLIIQKTREIVSQYKPRFLSLSLSLDGIGPKHDEMRGVNKAYDRVISTLERLGEIPQVQLGVEFTITPQNHEHLEQVFELSRRYQAKFLAGFSHNSDIYYQNTDTPFLWKDNDLGTVESLLSSLVKEKIKTETPLPRLFDPYDFFILNSVKYAKNPRRRFRCHSGVHSLFLDPQGNVYPCLILNRKLGNIREQNFDDFWLSPRAEGVRKEIERGGCHCWVACETTNSLLRSLSLVAWNLRKKVLRLGKLN